MIEALGSQILLFGEGVVSCVALFVTACARLVERVVRLRFRFRESMNQMYLIGVESTFVCAVALTFISLMLILEFSYHMKLVLRQDSLVPAFSTILMLRELGPVMTGLLLGSRVGAGIAAELGTMTVTEQIDALKLLGIDPVEYLIVPRWIGSLFASLTLTLVGVGLAILGGALLAALALRYPLGQFFNTMFVFTRFHDVGGCLIKAAVFGTIIPFVAAYHGLHTKKGSEGVGNAATNAVVQISILIIGADFLLTYLLYRM